MSPVEVDVSSPRRLHFNEIMNDDLRRLELDFLEEKRDESQVKLASYQRKMMRYYNAKVKKRVFRIGDLALRRVFPSAKDPGTGTLGPNWEGPYRITAEIRPGTYEIENLNGKVMPHPWNIKHLRKYYQQCV